MSTSSLHVVVHSRGSVVRARVAGKLDAATVRVFLDAIEPLAEGARQVVLDCEALEFCDSTGLRSFVVVRNRIGVPGALTLDRPSDELRRLLEITGLTGFLDE
ncbi:STAS domain-containing protein [Iamia sp. SCSIO 61187]|uniref:STAS domain-containing protein n=1 Tax=Iamia sp. SCSIO 61187 TaxID=2722752 RepID=UPI001C626ABF|nr:STAS domain-containing protein [Iamia sp. SCSIO 61187]QYG94924.1 STAS domain-containing protein [Iamia sp. SCSIO 61187]